MSPAQRNAIRTALLARDQDRFSEVLVQLVAAGEPASVVEREAEAMLATLPHEVHQWWDGPCDCMTRQQGAG